MAPSRPAFQSRPRGSLPRRQGVSLRPAGAGGGCPDPRAFDDEERPAVAHRARSTHAATSWLLPHRNVGRRSHRPVPGRARRRAGCRRRIPHRRGVARVRRSRHGRHPHRRADRWTISAAAGHHRPPVRSRSCPHLGARHRLYLAGANSDRPGPGSSPAQGIGGARRLPVQRRLWARKELAAEVALHRGRKGYTATRSRWCPAATAGHSARRRAT